MHQLSLGFDPIHLPQQDRDIGVLAQDPADRLCDLAWRENRGRDLIEEWLEQVVIAAVDQCDPDACYPAEALRDGKPAKAASDHENVMFRVHAPLRGLSVQSGAHCYPPRQAGTATASFGDALRGDRIACGKCLLDGLIEERVLPCS
jgi:hypothetical protein